MKNFKLIKNTLECFLGEKFKPSLIQMLQQLEVIQKNMKKYLEKRRMEVPRFYFLSDEDIFEMLGKSKDPIFINQNIKKMFEGVQELLWNKGQQKQTKTIEYSACVSNYGEKLDFIKKIELGNNINTLIEQLEIELRNKLLGTQYQSLVYI